MISRILCLTLLWDCGLSLNLFEFSFWGDLHFLPWLRHCLLSWLRRRVLRRCLFISPVSQPSILAAPSMPDQVVAAATSQKTHCSHCGRTNHTEERCFKKYPHLLVQMRKRASSRRGPHASSSSTNVAAPSQLRAAAAPQLPHDMCHSHQHLNTNCFHNTNRHPHLSSSSSPTP
jgi:hypothetical protein